MLTSLSDSFPQIGHCRSDRGTQKLHDGPCRSCDGQLEWMCKDNTCVNMTQLCDGHVDCSDGSDETWCTFTCSDGHNISMDKYVQTTEYINTKLKIKSPQKMLFPFFHMEI